MKQDPCLNCKENCCIGEYSTFVTLQDVKRIAGFTKKRPDEFAVYGDISSNPVIQEELIREKTHSYFEYSDDGKILQLRSKPNGECIFLEKSRCAIYASRPLICKISPVGFRRSGEAIRLLVEEEDVDCCIAESRFVSDVLEHLDFTESEARALISQFLSEVEEYKSKIGGIDKDSLNRVIEG